MVGLMVNNMSAPYIDHYAWVSLKTYLPVKRIGNKFLKYPGIMIDINAPLSYS
jgi:hypothetical protein